MFGSVVNVTCEKGYTFDSGRVITVRCNETGQWDGLQDGCQRVYNLYSKCQLQANLDASLNVVQL